MKNVEWKAYKMVLCAGRHTVPQAIDGAIFDYAIDPTDLEGMMEVCNNKLADCYKLDLYVTGLSVALVTVINFCVSNAIGLRLWHYNRDTDDYYSQFVNTIGGSSTAAAAGIIPTRPYGKNPWDVDFWD